MCFRVSLWHASPHKFTDFDFSTIGGTSLKYGYGIYFARTSAQAKMHVPNAKYLYRVDIRAATYNRLLQMEKRINEQSSAMVAVASTLKDVGEISKWESTLGFSYASGHSLYKAACASFGRDLDGVLAEKAAASFFLSMGIPGSITRDNSEEIITIYCPKLVNIVSTVDIA